MNKCPFEDKDDQQLCPFLHPNIDNKNLVAVDIINKFGEYLIKNIPSIDNDLMEIMKEDFLFKNYIKKGEI